MVKFDLVLSDGRIHVETIDDAEGTPGSSRQYARFNAECKPELEQAVHILTADNSADQKVDVLTGTPLNYMRLFTSGPYSERFNPFEIQKNMRSSPNTRAWKP